MNISVLIENPACFFELLSIPEVAGIYLPGERLKKEQLKDFVQKCHEKKKECYYAFPFVFRDQALAEHEACAEVLSAAGFDGWLIRSLDEAGFVRDKQFKGKKIFDAGMYSWNRLAAEQLRMLGADVLTAPYEMNSRELKARGMEDTELVIYGHLPVMLSAQCMQKTAGKGCRRGSGAEYAQYVLKDRKGAEFVAENRCRFCYNVIYNSVPLWLLDRQEAFPERIRFQFSLEKPGVPSQILRAFLRGESKPEGAFTRGHFARGVE